MSYWKVLSLTAFAAATLSAQWLDYKTPGIPRTADGKPNLGAPAPRTADGKPDLTGLWQVDGIGNAMDMFGGQKVPMTPAALALYDKHLATYGQGEPTNNCLPSGPKAGLFGVQPLQIIQTPKLTAILYEEGAFRQIHSDGRALPKSPNPSWMGYSVGHWDKDVFVVETAGYNDKSWLDYLGHPHTEDLRMTERLRRTDFGHLVMDITFEDPKSYSKPLTAHFTMTYQPDTDMIEYVCAENERDGKHLIGVIADEKKYEVQVQEKTLALYDGDYEFPFMGVMKVEHSGGQLTVRLPGGEAKNPAFAQSEKKFILPAYGGTVEFVRDANGKVTHMLMTSVEGEDRGARKN